jgi:hypothetical protein
MAAAGFGCPGVGGAEWARTFRLGGPMRPGARAAFPRLMLVSLLLGELPIRDAMVGTAALDQAHRGEDAAVEGTAHRRPLFIDRATPLTEMNAGSRSPPSEIFGDLNRAHQVCKDSPLEGDGFELPVPRKDRRDFETASCTTL